MSWHTVAYKGTVAATADTDISAVTDGILAIQNSHFILPTSRQLIWARAGSATITRARLASPTLRQVFNPYIRPLDGALQPSANPNVWLLDQNPLTLPWGEEIQYLATSGIGAGGEPTTLTLGLQSSFTPWPAGRVYPARVSSTTAAAAYAWTALALTWADTIPAGVYAMCLSEHNSTTGIAHRWTFSNQIDRPGLLSYANATARHPNAWNYGNLGVMGTFRSNDLPRLEVFCETTDASHDIYAWLVQVGPLS